MFDAPSPDLDTQPDWAAAVLEGRVALLGRFAEVGLEIALAIERQAKAVEPGDEAPVRAFAAYARVARAVRLTLMLQAKVVKQRQALDSLAAQHAFSAAARDGGRRYERAGQQKARLERIVERIAKRQHDDPAEIERLVDETCERLDNDDLYGDILARPTSELIALICQDLGLDPDWPSLAREAWAREEIARGVWRTPPPPPSPFPSPLAGEADPSPNPP